MKRRFAVPAAIALTAHALLFMGSGKPPTPTPDPITIVDGNADPGEKIALVPEPPPTSAEEESSGGENTGAIPKGIVELRPVIFTGRGDDITQRFDPTVPGKGTTLVGISRGDGPGEGVGGLGPKTVAVSKLDNPPVTRFQKAPVYPSALKASGTSGTVWVDFVVDGAGRVHDVRVVKSTHPGFEDATMAAVSQWRFEPGKRKGIPVRFRMSIPVVFNLAV